MTMTDFRTVVFQLDGSDVAAGDMIRVKPSGPYQRDGFIGKVLYADFGSDGALSTITVYGGPAHYGSTRTFYVHRFETLDPKVQERQRLAKERVAEKAAEKAEKSRRGKK